MRRERFHDLLTIALVAALINALVPTISYVLARSQGVQIVEVCTSFGIKKVALDAAGRPVEHQSPAHGAHCQFCMAAQDAAAIPTLPTLPGHPVLVAFDGSICGKPLARPATSWLQARPRAPPIPTAPSRTV